MSLISIICIAILATILAGLLEVLVLAVRRKKYTFRGKRFCYMILACLVAIFVFLYWGGIFGHRPAVSGQTVRGISNEEENQEDSNKAMVIHPSIGIPGVIARGMTLFEMQKVSSDISSWEYQISIPSAGATFTSDHKGREGAPFRGNIDFVVDGTGFASEYHRGLKFKGSVLGGPSFAGDPVPRDDIVASFGEPERQIESIFPSTNFNIAFWRCMTTEQRFSQRHNSGPPNEKLNHESLYYLDKGLRFSLKDGFVSCVTVTPLRDELQEWAESNLKSAEMQLSIQKETRRDPATEPTPTK